MKADKLLYNGLVYTGLSEKAYGYLALSKNRVLAVGRGSGKDYAGRNTELIDLHGGCATPGLIDSHLHFLDYAMSLHRMNLEKCSTSVDIDRVLQERARRAKPGEWILGRGWQRSHFNGFPHKKILDAVFPGNPVVIESHDAHFLWVNTAALKAAGLMQSVPVTGGYVGTDPDGTCDGIIGENAIPLVRKHVPQPDSTSRRQALLEAQSRLHSMGITGFHGIDASCAFGDLQDLLAESQLRLRVFHSIPENRLKEATHLSLKSGFGNDWFRLGFVKFFSDGALGSLSAHMLEPYTGSGGLGIQTIPEEELTEKIALALQHGIAVGVHAIGDRANRQTLNAFEKNAAFLTIPRARSRIEHAQLLHPADIPRFHQLGVVASMQPYHAVSDCTLAERYWGERSRYSYAWRSLLESGATVIFGSDGPIEDPDPLPGLRAAVHRENWEDRSQTITPFDALLAYTWAPAVAAGLEKQLGSLERGKFADFVVFSQDPYQSAFQGIKVLATAVNGEFVYREIESR